MSTILDEVYEILMDRKNNTKPESYTAKLLYHEKGLNKILEKIGEESTELILAAKDGNKRDIIHETADLIYHVLVLLVKMDIKPEEIWNEMEKGEGERYCVVWKVNLDRRKSRSEGRRIPRRFSVPNVKLAEIVEACRELGIQCKAEEKMYPKCWWEEGGRVIVPKTGSKTELMIKIARKIHEIREKRKGKGKK